MRDEHDWIDAELDALARDDERVAVPPRIQDAVLLAWDRRPTAPPAKRYRAGRAAVLAAAATAAAVVMLQIALRESETASPTVHSGVARPSSPPSAQPPAIGGIGAAPAAAIVPGRLPMLAISDAYVLVPDPLAGETPMSVVRVRLSRMDVAAIGLPIADPYMDGLVELEMLVGDDGVARSIRRAAVIEGIRNEGEGEQP